LRQLPAEAGGRTLAVALTAFARSEDRSRAFLAGFDMYLPKPVDPGELMALVVSLNQRLKGDHDRVTPSLPPPSSALPASARPLSDLKVLVVDGDADARADVVRTLAAAGALVSACDSAESALRQFEALEPHVMVCSLELPDRDGARLLRDLRLRDGHRATPAIALTRGGSTEEARAAILSGFQAHVEKSAAIDGLVARVAKLSAWSFRKTSA
jgi:DNA-binding response OmpR family regulator